MYRSAVLLCLACWALAEVHNQEFALTNVHANIAQQHQDFSSRVYRVSVALRNLHRRVEVRSNHTDGSENACHVALGAIYNATAHGACSLDDDTFTSARTESFCRTTNCPAALLPLFATFKRACAHATIDAEFQDLVDVLPRLLRLRCFALDGVNCFDAFFGVLSSFGDDGEPTAADIAAFCSPCVTRIMREMTMFDPEFAREMNFTQILCLKDEGEFCFPKFMAVASIFEEGESPGASARAFNFMCSTGCFAKAAALADQFGLEESSVPAPKGLMCNRNPAGEVCMSKVLLAPDISAACEDVGTCTPECKNALRAFFQDTKCCGMNFFTMMAVDEGPEFMTEVRDFITDGCGIRLPGHCPGFKRFLVKLLFPNLDCTWATSNSAAAKMAIAKDVAPQAKVPWETINVTITCVASSGRRSAQSVSADVNFESSSDVTATDIAAASPANLNSLPDDAKVDSTAAVTQGGAPVVTSEAESLDTGACQYYSQCGDCSNYPVCSWCKGTSSCAPSTTSCIDQVESKDQCEESSANTMVPPLVFLGVLALL